MMVFLARLECSCSGREVFPSSRDVVSHPGDGPLLSITFFSGYRRGAVIRRTRHGMNEPGRASSGDDREPRLILSGPVVVRLRSCLLELHPLRTPRVREVGGQMWCAPGWLDQRMIGVDVPPSSASRLSSFMLS